jgi:hypothetical protein
MPYYYVETSSTRRRPRQRGRHESKEAHSWVARVRRRVETLLWRRDSIHDEEVVLLVGTAGEQGGSYCTRIPTISYLIGS